MNDLSGTAQGNAIPPDVEKSLVEQRSATLEDKLARLTESVHSNQNQLDETRIRLDQLILEMRNQFAHVNSVLENESIRTDKHSESQFLSLAHTSLAETRDRLDTIIVEARNQLADVNQRLSNLDDNLKRSVGGEVIPRLDQSLAETKIRLEQIIFENTNHFAHLDGILANNEQSMVTLLAEKLVPLVSGANDHALGHLNTLLIEARNHASDANQRLTNIDGNLKSLSSDQIVPRLDRYFDETKMRLEQIISEVRNQFSDVCQRLDTVLLEQRNLTLDQTSSLMSRINQAQWDVISEVNAAAQLSLSNQSHKPLQSYAKENSTARLTEPKILSFEDTLEEAKKLLPRIYPLWHDRLVQMQRDFEDSKFGNAANALDPVAHAFKNFIGLHARGTLLDIGCGTFGLPFYLKDYPVNLIAGLDPLKPSIKPPFQFAQGISEFLPWPNASFQTVVSATALDHALSLDKSVSEINRIMAPGGTLLIWIGSIRGAAPYEPDEKNFTPADHRHLFHFDTAWFEPLLDKTFDLDEKLVFRTEPFDHVFYKLTTRQK